MAQEGQVNNFTTFTPRKGGLNIEIKLPFSDETQKQIDDNGLDMLGYDRQWGTYRIRLHENDIVTNKTLLKELLQKAYENSK